MADTTPATLAPDALPVGRQVRVRHVLNWLNLSTPLGLGIARVGGCRVRRGPELSFLADHYRWRFPAAGAFTVGDVVISRHDLDVLAARRPTLVHHELVHSRQWAYCLGLPFLLLAAGLGWVGRVSRWVRDHYLLIKRTGGALLIALGLLMAAGVWEGLTAWVQSRLVSGFETVI